MIAADGAIEARGLRKQFGKRTEAAALGGLDLSVPTGSVCGLLGPNGAGKTTTVRILTTLLAMDEGSARVAGCDVRTQGSYVRQRIGLVGQSTAVDEILSGRQNLEMFGRLNHLPRKAARHRADELLERFSLTDAGAKPVGAYSGGMRRRLDLAASLIANPTVLFVDEPTTGLDPAGRREVWGAIRELVDGGMTVLLTTQYLEEADALADQIVMLKAGQVVAAGTPNELKASVGNDWIDVEFVDAASMASARKVLERVAVGRIQEDRERLRLSVPVRERTRALVQVATALGERQIEPRDVTLRRPTLDEVFLQLTSETPSEEVHA
jgi:ABC-2 type transport system ATP-binding protein